MLSDILIDLLTEFDEMGFCPTNLCESPEEYAIDWKKDLIVAIEDEKEQVAREILNDLKGLLEGYVHIEDNISLYEYYCKKYRVNL